MKYRLTISDAISLVLLAAVGALGLFLYSIDGDIMKWMHQRRMAERMQLVGEFHRFNPLHVKPAPAFGDGWSVIEHSKLEDTEWNGPGLLPGDPPLLPEEASPPPAK